MSSATELIDEKRKHWVRAVNAQDVESYLKVLTTDVVWFPPGQPALRGKEAFESWVRPFFEGFEYNFALEQFQVQIAGDWAVELGEFHTEMTSTVERRTGQHEGGYLVIWRRDSSESWLIDRYVDGTYLRGISDSESAT